jgi:hypothetical protein
MPKVEFPSWLYTERETELELVDMLESGELRTGIDRGNGMVDHTVASLIRAKERLAHTELLIRMFEELRRS